MLPTVFPMIRYFARRITVSQGQAASAKGKHMHSPKSESTDYCAYLLRLWRNGPERPWRASLQATATGTLHHFADMAHLLAFLQAHTNCDDAPTGDGQEP